RRGVGEVGWGGEMGVGADGGVVGRTGRLEQNREQVARMVAALLDTMDHIGKNRTKVLDYLNTKWNMNRELAEQLLVNDFIPLLTMDGRMTMEAVQDYLDQAFQTNQIPNRAKANLVVDLSLVDQAQAKKEKFARDLFSGTNRREHEETHMIPD